MKLTLVLTVSAVILTVYAEEQAGKNETDLVTRTELWKYVTALDKILNYCSQNKIKVDMNIYQGLFLMRVFLNRYWDKPLKNLPLPVRNKLSLMMRKQQYLRKHFDTKVKEDTRSRDKANKKIYTLMNDEAPWVAKLKKFQSNAWDEPTPSDKKLEQLYSTWNVYSKYVMDVFNFKNKNTTFFLVLFAKCLENIAQNPRIHSNDTNMFKNCTTSDVCQYLIEHEVDYGYIVTHKLLILQNAHYGRSCYIYSKILDEELVKRFCQAVYGEAEYIGNHDTEYLLTDLHMEQILLCGLEGYADFLKKTWISNILKMQDSSGCIKFRHNSKRTGELSNTTVKNTSLTDDKVEEWEIVKVSTINAMDNLPCNAHTTGLAIGTFGLAIRYILDSLDVIDVQEMEKKKNDTKTIKANKKIVMKHT